jgi:N6-adenosine-specific RNA methylase IME4
MTETMTPPEIVAASDKPNEALAAFIGQELEHWGFDVEGSTGSLIVKANGQKFMVGIGEWS